MGSDDEQEERTPLTYARLIIPRVVFFLWTVSLEIAIICLVISGSEGVSANDEFGFNNDVFHAHPPLMVFGLILVLSQGITIHALLRPFVPLWVVRMLHGLIGIFWLTFLIPAFIIIVNQVDNADKPYDNTSFVQVHERVGLLVFVLAFFQVLIGLIKFTLKTALHWSVLQWHGRLGYIIYALGLVAVGTGVQLLFESDALGYQGEAIAIYVLLAVLGVSVIFFDFWVQGGGVVPKKEKDTELQNRASA